jgi:hypothetical protein
MSVIRKNGTKPFFYKMMSFYHIYKIKNSYLYIKAAKSFFNVPREKLSARPFAAEQDNFEHVKGFRGQVYTTFLCMYVSLGHL